MLVSLFECVEDFSEFSKSLEIDIFKVNCFDSVFNAIREHLSKKLFKVRKMSKTTANSINLEFKINKVLDRILSFFNLADIEQG